jgi:hypothetical protein
MPCGEYVMSGTGERNKKKKEAQLTPLISSECLPSLPLTLCVSAQFSIIHPKNYVLA